MFRKISADWISPRSDANHRHTYHRKNTRLRVTLSLLMVLALVFCMTGVFAGSVSALGGTVNDGDCVLIRGVKSGKNLMIPGGLDNATNQPNIILYDAHDDYGSQKWLVKKLTVSGREYTVFRSYFAQQYVLAFNGTANANGGRLYLKKLASTTAAAPAEAQFFVRDSAGGGNTKTGVARLVTRKSIEANDWHTLDGVGGATANNTQIQQYTQFTTVDASVNQLWVFEKGTTSTVNGRVTASVSAGTLQTWDLVDSGGHADWDGNLPTYQGLFETACATWNSKVGRTIFRKDSLINLQDFKIREAVRCPWVEFPEKTLAATYPNNPTYSSDQKSLIVSTELFGKVENNSDAQHLKTIMHELGHVLGLDHTNGRGNLLSQGAYAYKTSFGLDDLVCFAAAEQRY